MCAMGAWLLGTVLVSIVATENFFTVDRLLAGSTSASFHAFVERTGQPQTRELLRYLSSELNRLYFQLWNVMQLALGLLVVWLIGRDSSVTRAWWGIVAMLSVVVLMTVWLAPEITIVGRSLDFVPRDPPPPALARFRMLHAAYTALEMGKLLVGVVVTLWISRITAVRAPVENR